MNKKLIIITSILFYGLSLYFSYSFFNEAGGIENFAMKKPTSTYSPPGSGSGAGNSINESDPKTEECPLNGQLLTKNHRSLWEKRRPLGVIIENHTDARPQSGLTAADVVYEAVAEGGITRFLTIFYCKDPSGYAGPIRSARMYFLELLQGYGHFPLFAHVGGANCNRQTGSGCANGAKADALGMIRKLDWQGHNDLNHVAFPVMWRDYDRLPGRATEHTVYSTTKKLWDYSAKIRKLTSEDEEGEKWDEGFIPWKFKDDAPVTTPLGNIAFDFWENKSDFSVSWDYDKKTNGYKRVNGGKPHLDKNNGKQINAKNVVVVFMDESPAQDGYQGGQHLLYKTTGQGDAIVFQDGEAIEGLWRRRDVKQLLTIFDKRGNEIKFNRGQIFIEIVPKGNKVSY